MTLTVEDWEELLNSLDEGRCTPFIGPEAYMQGVPAIKNISTEWAEKYPHELAKVAQFLAIKNIATEWAEKYQYPLEDSHELAKVAQFLAIDRGDNMYPKKDISRELKGIQPPNFSLDLYRNTPYAVLADLNLPIYITTNYDKFMEAALKSSGKEPVSEFCRWNEELYRYVTKAGLISIFDKEKEYTPSPERPLVYHLYGVYDQASTMVLTEKDYIDFVISLNKGDEKISLPTVVRTALATTPLLFVGYRLEDISFRVIFQGVTSFLGVKRPNISIAVQLPPVFSEEKKKKAQEYLTQYTKNMFEINVYWGNADEFVKDLRERLDDFRNARGKQ